MAKLTSNVENQKDEKAKYLAENNVKDVTKSDLTALKSTLKVDTEANLDTELTAINNSVEYIFNGFLTEEGNREKSLTLKLDTSPVTTITKTPKAIIISGNKAERDALTNYIIDLTGYDQALDKVKDTEIQATLKDYKFELNDLWDDVNPSNEDSDNPLEDDMNEGENNDDEENKEDYIDPTNLTSTTIDDITYYNFDKNNNDKVSNRELKKEGIVNRNRNNDKDKNTAILGILNAAVEKDFKKMDIKSINRDDLTNILDEMLDPSNDFLADVVDSSGNIDKQKFRSAFRKEFVKTDKYDKKGIFNFLEVTKICNVIAKALEDKDSGTGLWEALQRLADVGESAKNIDYTAARNNDVMLEKIGSESVFLFLCDFDSDGVVNSTDIVGKDRENKKRRDTGSVMGGQLYTNFLEYADTERSDIDDDKIEEKKIIDGTKTSALIQRILEATANESDNDNLINAINDFIEKETENDGTITMEEFTTFMRNGEYTPAGADAPINISATADVKEFIKSLADSINEKKDLSWLFTDKEVTQKQILEQTRVMTALEDSFTLDMDNPFLEDMQASIKKNIDDFVSANDLQQEFNEDDLDGVRTTCLYNTIKIVNFVTDLIYLNLGTNTSRAIADMFSDAKFAGIKYNFYHRDGTINEKKVKEALGGYISQHLVTSIGAGYALDKSLILGASISYDKLSTDLGDKFQAHASVGIDLKNILKGGIGFNFDIGAGKSRQINKPNVTKLNTKKPIPVNRIGIEGGLNISSLKDFGLYVGLGFERDYPAGIEQKARYYDAIMNSVLGYPSDIQVYTSKSAFIAGMELHMTELMKTNADVTDNKDFLYDMIDEMAKEMELVGVFELIRKEDDPVKQKALLKYMYMTAIDAFHENAIEQKSYEQLTGKVKLTKFSLKTSLANILMRTGVGAGIGSIVPGWGTIIGAATGLVTGMLTFSTWKTSYVEDAFGKGRQNYKNIGTGVGAEDKQDIIDTKDVDILIAFLDKELNPNEKLVNVAVDDDEEKIVITGINGTNPLKYLNVYYAANALTDDTFCFEDNKLVIGNAGMRIARDIKRDKVETFLMIGEELGGDMTKLAGATENKIADVNKIEEEEYYKEFTYTQLETFVTNDANLAPYKTAILGFFDTEGKIKAPHILQGTQATVGTLTFKQKIDGTVSLESYDNDLPVGTTDLNISYVIQEKPTTTVTIEKIKYNETERILVEEIFVPTFADTFTPGVEKTLSLFENLWAATLFEKFIVAAVDADIDTFINEIDYGNAFCFLKEILAKNSAAYEGLTDLHDLIEDKQSILTIEDKAFIVDKFKAIFSYDTRFTTGSMLSSTRSRVGYKKLFGPDELTKYPLERDYKKEDIQPVLSKSKTLERTPVDNLVGFTAFYRAKNNEGRKFSMTAVGGTNVLTNGNLEESMAKIDEADLPATKTWFTKNLETNTTNKGVILDKLNLLLESQDIVLLETDLTKLFNEEYVSVDNGSKMVKLDLQYYFYLLGECSNESIGAIINNILVYEKGDYIEKTIDGKTGGIKDTKWNIGLQTQTVNAEYDISATQKDLTLSAAIGGLKKKKDVEKDDQYGEDEEDDQGLDDESDDQSGDDTGGNNGGGKHKGGKHKKGK